MPSIAHVQVMPKLSGVQNFSLHILKDLPFDEKYLICSEAEQVAEGQREEFIQAFTEAGVKIIWAKHLCRSTGPHDLAATLELWQIFRRYRFDIVHTNSTKPGVIARIAARLAGIKKVIHTVHGIAFHEHESLLKRVFYYGLEAFALQFGHVNVSVNKFYLRYYRPFFWKKNCFIYNGINPEKWINQAPVTPSLSEAEEGKAAKRVLFVGRLDTQKNPLTAIRAFACLLGKLPGAHFDMVGDGELRADCEALVRELGIEQQVTFHGWIGNPEHFYARCDVFFCPSLYEAFGFTFTEAALFSRPIVASDVEGIPEVVIANKMGLICSADDYAAQADCLYRILTDSSLAAEFGRFGRQHVIEHFPLSNCLKQYLKLYTDE
ncbi:glycosyltransferase family 4 protein [Erwinia sp. Leaf53]|uniref:glycosyltransferase family 4 protein n=1 Tax=Erwinia sp. Leaf53 TaxID=1736225 RepID=UPI0006F76CE1|nr:glycosyltransferase family 4 protein [Erwinia sp. Leaf53]KQN63691.1 hypothetical protein ASF13_19130 [Erwinia sp. Leaf53]